MAVLFFCLYLLTVDTPMGIIYPYPHRYRKKAVYDKAH